MADPYSSFGNAFQSSMGNVMQMGIQGENRKSQKEMRAMQAEENRQQAEKRELEMSDMFKARLKEAADEPDAQIRGLAFKSLFGSIEKFTNSKAPSPLTALAQANPEMLKAILDHADKNGMTLKDVWQVASDPLKAADALLAFGKAKQHEATRTAMGDSGDANTMPMVSDSEDGPNKLLITSIQARISALRQGVANAVKGGAHATGVKALQDRLDKEENNLFDLMKQGGQIAAQESAKPVPDSMLGKLKEPGEMGNLVYPGITYGEVQEHYRGKMKEAKKAEAAKQSGTKTVTPKQVAETKPRIQNKDGSVSTERTITAEMDGKHYVIPTVVNGRAINPDLAVKLFQAGANPSVGEFASAKEAEAFAVQRSKDIGTAINTQAQAGAITTPKASVVSGATVKQGPADLPISGDALPEEAPPQGRGFMSESEGIKFKENEQLRAQPAPVWAQQEYGVTNMGDFIDGMKSGKYRPISGAELGRREQAGRTGEMVAGKKLEDIQKSGEKARVSYGQAQSMYAILGRAGNTGPLLGPIRSAVNAGVQTIMGGNFQPQGMDELQLLSAMSTKMAIEDLQRVMGNDSDRDFNRAITSNPGVLNTRSANRTMLLFRMALDEIEQHRAANAQKWVEKYGSLSRSNKEGQTFDQAWGEWAKRPENSALDIVRETNGYKKQEEVYKSMGMKKPAKEAPAKAKEPEAKPMKPDVPKGEKAKPNLLRSDAEKQVDELLGLSPKADDKTPVGASLVPSSGRRSTDGPSKYVSPEQGIANEWAWLWGNNRPDTLPELTKVQRAEVGESIAKFTKIARDPKVDEAKRDSAVSEIVKLMRKMGVPKAAIESAIRRPLTKLEE